MSEPLYTSARSRRRIRNFINVELFLGLPLAVLYTLGLLAPLLVAGTLLVGLVAVVYQDRTDPGRVYREPRAR